MPRFQAFNSDIRVHCYVSIVSVVVQLSGPYRRKVKVYTTMKGMPPIAGVGNGYTTMKGMQPIAISGTEGRTMIHQHVMSMRTTVHVLTRSSTRTRNVDLSYY